MDKQLHNIEKAEKRKKIYVPAVDIFENNENYVLFAEIPGSAENDVEITLEKNVLMIYATVNEEIPEGYRLFYSEYGLGDYKRSFELNSEIDQEKIEASVKNGVLKLILPKVQPTVKKITIKSA